MALGCFTGYNFNENCLFLIYKIYLKVIKIPSYHCTMFQRHISKHELLSSLRQLYIKILQFINIVLLALSLFMTLKAFCDLI